MLPAACCLHALKARCRTHRRCVWVVLLRALPSQGPLGEAKGRPVKGDDARARSGLRESRHYALPAEFCRRLVLQYIQSLKLASASSMFA